MTISKIISSNKGKRKTSVAKVYLENGNGKILINNKDINIYFASLLTENFSILKPLILLNLENKYNIFIKVHGGGLNSQLEAIQLALSKAILNLDNNSKSILKQNLLLFSDSRKKESKKYGLRKARKAPQYSKR